MESLHQGLLVPSQLITNSQVGTTAFAAEGADVTPSLSRRHHGRPRHRRRNANNSQRHPGGSGHTAASATEDDAAAATDGNAASQQLQQQQQQQQQSPSLQSSQQRQRTRRNRRSLPAANRDNAPARATTQQKSQPDKKSSNSKTRGNKNWKRYPWRKHIPPGTMDPITLDPLEELTYPPFALVANEPYVPVPEWPPKEDDSKKDEVTDRTLAEEERQRRILQEQWGEKLKPNDNANDPEPPTGAASEGPRHYNLYDGRALAYYLVSQLQFIDPLNRRDLTRDELVNLDQYLRRHKLQQAGVLEAYDAKGITLSTAGATATTAAGRAEILQQQAAQLLQALFGGSSVRGRGNRQKSAPPQTSLGTSNRNGDNNSNNNSSNQNMFQQQYQSHEHRQQNRAPRNSAREVDMEQETAIVYGDDDSGLYIVDDDVNPSLRGAGISEMAAAVANAQHGSVGSNSNLFWSTSHIRGQLGGIHPVLRPDNFPALMTPSEAANSSATDTETEAPALKTEAPPSKSLLKIAKAVKTTDPEELQRQRAAREEAVRRAMMSNLSFGADVTAMNGWTNTSTAVATAVAASDGGPSEAQLQRNKAFADALGVKPATLRASSGLFSGWARPADGKIELDEFGNELNAAIYPASLIGLAKERMGQLLKLEKKWKIFLASDTAASLPLPPMDKITRGLVHEYGDFWKLKTESFDPEPRRYIHCVKLRDTCAPYPLLSEAVRNLRGPSAAVVHPPAPTTVSPIVAETLIATQVPAAAAAVAKSLPAREFPPPPERVPLPLKPRSNIPPLDGSNSANSAQAPPRLTDSGDGEKQATSRFDVLFSGRERPKLALAPRTRPLELPPFQPQAAAAAESKALGETFQEKLAAKARKEQEQEAKKKQILEKEFASSDESEVESVSSSDWEDEEPLYSGSDEDE